MTTYGYTRTSTADKQTDDLQRQALIAAGVHEARIFADQISGAKEARKRPGWASLDDRLDEGDELVVWRIDRIGRSMIDVITTVADMTKRGIIVRSISDNIDPTTANGRLMLNMMASFAEYERELIQERVRAGVFTAQANGVKFGRPAPDAKVVAENLSAIDHLVKTQGISPVEAAARFKWSKSTYYRHLAAAKAAGVL